MDDTCEKLHIGLISEIDGAAGRVAELLHTWSGHDDRFDVILVCGVGAPPISASPEEAFGQSTCRAADFATILSGVENICPRVAYIPARNDPLAALRTIEAETFTSASANCHHNVFEIIDGLWIGGFGGGIFPTGRYTQDDIALGVENVLQQFKTRTQSKHAAVTAQAGMTGDDVAPSSSSDELILLLSVAPGMSETDVWSTPAPPVSASEEPCTAGAAAQWTTERVISTARGPIRATRGVKPIRMIPESAYKSDAAQMVYPSKLTAADDADDKRRVQTAEGLGEGEGEGEEEELLVRGTRKNCTPSDENGRDVLTAINPVFGSTGVEPLLISAPGPTPTPQLRKIDDRVVVCPGSLRYGGYFTSLTLVRGSETEPWRVESLVHHQLSVTTGNVPPIVAPYALIES